MYTNPDLSVYLSIYLYSTIRYTTLLYPTLPYPKHIHITTDVAGTVLRADSAAVSLALRSSSELPSEGLGPKLPMLCYVSM